MTRKPREGRLIGVVKNSCLFFVEELIFWFLVALFAFTEKMFFFIPNHPASNRTAWTGQGILLHFLHFSAFCCVEKKGLCWNGRHRKKLSNHFERPFFVSLSPFSLVTCIFMYIFVFALSALPIFSSPPLVFWGGKTQRTQTSHLTLTCSRSIDHANCPQHSGT